MTVVMRSKIKPQPYLQAPSSMMIVLTNASMVRIDALLMLRETFLSND